MPVKGFNKAAENERIDDYWFLEQRKLAIKKMLKIQSNQTETLENELAEIEKQQAELKKKKGEPK